MNININTFNNWAASGKDKSMEKGHYSSVNKMFEILQNETNILKSNFSFIDIGCGNGWVIRKILENPYCEYALGIDGAENMIKNALKFKIGHFIKTDIEKFNFKEKFDIIFSMETLYYLDNIDGFIKNIYNNALKPNGSIIIGLDHYKENKSTLTWGKDYNLKTNTLSINEWRAKLENYRFSKLKIYQHGQKEGWEGTLILHGKK